MVGHVQWDVCSVCT